MRLLSQAHSEYKGRKYKKFWIVIPSKIIKNLGWKKGQELGARVKRDKLVIEKN